jgi:drug/metabolite transporter (DMT)-like permease
LTKQERIWIFGGLALINVLWVPVNLLLRTATDDGASPGAIAAIRWTLLGLIMSAGFGLPGLRRLTRYQKPSTRDAWMAVGCGALLFAPAHLVYYDAIRQTSTTEATVLGSSAPVFVAALSFALLRERASWRRILAIAVGVAGVWLVSVGFSVPHLDAGHTTGNLRYLAGVGLESIAGVLTTQLVRRSSGIAILRWMVVGAIPTLWLAVVRDPASFAIANAGWVSVGCIAYLVLIAGLFNFGVWYTTVERAPLSVMVVTLMAQAPLSALLGWWVRHEVLNLATWIGTALIMAALLIGAEDVKPSSESDPR